MYSEELKTTLKVLKEGKTILYPTDTVWGIGCDATNYRAINRVFELKKRDTSKALIILVSDTKMLKQYIEYVPKLAYDIIKFSKKPTTIIYDKPVRVAENCVAKNNTLAIRVVNRGFAHQLIKAFNKPIVSTSANASGLAVPKSFKEIAPDILKGVDYVVNLPNYKMTKQPSVIIKLSNADEVEIIRQ